MKSCHSFSSHRLSGIWCATLLVLAFSSLHANDQLRTWTYASGEKRKAEILGFDEETRMVRLRMEDGTEVEKAENLFSTLDKAWILEWIEQEEEAREKLAKIGGTVTVHTSTGAYPTRYAVYRPANVGAEEAGPMMLLFHPGGNGVRRIYFYIEAAAESGMTLVSFDYFKNNGPKDMHARFAELLPQVEAQIPHDPKRLFMGGNSGGAMRSYSYSAEFDRPWAGIFAAGGWLGPRDHFEKLDYPPMRVAMINGDKDRGANFYLDRDMEHLNKEGCTVSVHAFEGGHQMPPVSVQKKAMKWLLETNEVQP